MRFSVIVLAAFSWLFGAPSKLLAQPFEIRVQTGDAISVVGPGSTILITANAVRQQASANVSITYRGTGRITFSQLDFFGAGNFGAAAAPDLPHSIAGGGVLAFRIGYTPVSSNRVTGRLTIHYIEENTGQANTLQLNLEGIAPNLLISYSLQTDGNAFPATPGTKIVFSPTQVNAETSATITIANRGSGPGLVSQIAITGALFQPQGLPLTPAFVEPGQELRFAIRYAPKQAGLSTGNLRLVAGGTPQDYPLEAAAAAPTFVYELASSTSTVAISPSSRIDIPHTNVGVQRILRVSVRNTGNGQGQIGTIFITGQGFQLTEVPPMPQNLEPGASLHFNIDFTPTQPGQIIGRLRIGADSFEFATTSLGPRLLYFYTAGDTTVPLAAGGGVSFNPQQAGGAVRREFFIRNEGTTAAIVSGIEIATANSPFTVIDLPGLPVTIEPGASISFGIRFAPTAVGAVTASLRIESETFALTGSGTAPPPLPDYQLAVVNGTVQAFQQPGVGLELSAPYALALTGALTLTIDPQGLSADPAVQFLSGGRTIAFSIPAGSKQAIFGGEAAEARLQTGTVAGNLLITPSFATPGGVNLTPESPRTLTLNVPRSAPRLLNSQIVSSGRNSFSIQVTGFATDRTLNTLTLDFTTVQGANLPTARHTLNVDSASFAWYSSPQSQAFGGLFTATIPFTLQGGRNDETINLADALQSVNITAGNGNGTSNVLTLELRGASAAIP